MEVQLSERELEIAEHLCDPTSLSENLIPLNENAPQTWDENADCIYLRPYQLTMQNYSYMYAYDSEKSPVENVRIKKGAGDLYSIGARNTGKCESILNKCQLADGSLKKFGDLIDTTQEVISFNDKTLKLEKDIAHFKDNGLQPCYKIVTTSGKEIIITENHPLYTEYGWKQAKDLKEDQMIATPRKLNINGKDIDDNLAKIIGYLLGDGSCTTSNISVTNLNIDIIEELYKLADYFNCRVRVNGYDAYCFAKKEIPKVRRGASRQNKIQQIVEKYKINCLAKNKIIHPEIFKWSNKNIALLLNRLFACDGYYNAENRWTVFEITLASKKLIYQIQALLLRFGIHSVISYKKAKYKNNFFDAWRLYVDKDVDKLLKEIGTFTKDSIVKKLTLYETSDLIPKNLVDRYKWELEGKWRKGLNNKRCYGISRNKLKSLVNDWYHQNLYRLANSDIYWEVIKEIKFVGDLPTVMVSVENNHTYISNNIISHNSFFLKIDICLSVIHQIVQGCVASFDAKHLKKVADGIADYVEGHSFLKIFHCRDTRKNTVRRDPLTISTEHGSLIKSVNEKVEGNNPGVGYHGLHFDTRWYEEYSYASKDGEEKTIDAVNSLGHIDRPSGIPDLCVGSPLGKILKDKSKKPWIWKLPQYIREDWDEQTEKDRIEFYKGKSSAAYKLNVEAETIEGAFGFWDMARLKEASFNKNRRIKFFEIGKDTFTLFEKMLIVERLAGTEQVFLCADMGFGAAPTEIIIVFFDGKKYIYEYNISLFRLTQEEQSEVFYFLYERMGGAFIAIDATSDEGVTIDYIYKKGVPIEYLLKVKFNANMEVGFEEDKHGDPIIDKSGDLIMKMANTREWAFQELPQLMYSGKMNIPLDTKFLNQFTNMIMQKTKAGKPLYSCKGENHLHSAFEVFAICRFNNEFKTIKNTQRTRQRCYGVFADGEVI